MRLDGFHAVKHARRFGAPALEVVVADRVGAAALAAGLAPDLADWIASAPEVPAAVIDRLAGRPVPTGVLGVADRPDDGALLARLGQVGPAPVVGLEAPRHLGNVGAAIRVAAAAGAAGVVTTGPADPWHPHAISGAAGLHYALAVRRLEGPEGFAALGVPSSSSTPTVNRSPGRCSRRARCSSSAPSAAE